MIDDCVASATPAGAWASTVYAIDVRCWPAGKFSNGIAITPDGTYSANGKDGTVMAIDPAR